MCTCVLGMYSGNSRVSGDHRHFSYLEPPELHVCTPVTVLPVWPPMSLHTGCGLGCARGVPQSPLGGPRLSRCPLQYIETPLFSE